MVTRLGLVVFALAAATEARAVDNVEYRSSFIPASACYSLTMNIRSEEGERFDPLAIPLCLDYSQAVSQNDFVDCELFRHGSSSGACIDRSEAAVYFRTPGYEFVDRGSVLAQFGGYKYRNGYLFRYRTSSNLSILFRRIASINAERHGIALERVFPAQSLNSDGEFQIRGRLRTQIVDQSEWGDVYGVVRPFDMQYHAFLPSGFDKGCDNVSNYFLNCTSIKEVIRMDATGQDGRLYEIQIRFNPGEFGTSAYRIDYQRPE